MIEDFESNPVNLVSGYVVCDIWSAWLFTGEITFVNPYIQFGYFMLIMAFFCY